MRARSLSLASLAVALSIGCGGPPKAALVSPVVVDRAARTVRFPATVRAPRGWSAARSRRLAEAVLESGLGSASAPLSLTISADSEHFRGSFLVRLTATLEAAGASIAKEEAHASAPTADEAEALTIGRLLTRLEIVLARHDGGARQQGAVVEAPSVIVIERVARTRDLLQLRFLETRTGAILREEIHVLPDAAHGPPAIWVLSARTAEGNLWGPLAYRSLATSLRPFFDLREIGETDFVGYFGRATKATTLPTGETSTPPRR